MKQSYSPSTWNGGDEITTALNITEGVTEKLDLILAKLISLDSKMEELNLTINGIQDKVAILETEIALVQDKQKTLDGKFSHMLKKAEFADVKITELNTARQILYLEAYSRREKLTFEGIPELVETTDQQNATSNEDTKKF